MWFCIRLVWVPEMPVRVRNPKMQNHICKTTFPPSQTLIKCVKIERGEMWFSIFGVMPPLCATELLVVPLQGPGGARTAPLRMLWAGESAAQAQAVGWKFLFGQVRA